MDDQPFDDLIDRVHDAIPGKRLFRWPDGKVEDADGNDYTDVPVSGEITIEYEKG